MHDKLRVLDLFSGIGGFSLGLERTGGFETVAFCEIDPFCRKVLKKHWPEVPQYDDVRTLTGERLTADGITVDVITGGFPCQDISAAGKRAGITDGTRSGLWSEIVRLACEIRPRYILIENVSNLLIGPSERPGGWFSRILCDLASIGYDAEWACITASSVGAPHERDRVWIVAYPNTSQFQRGGISRRIYQEHTHFSDACWGKDKPGVVRTLNGISNQMDRVGALGNAVVPQIPEIIGRAILKAENEH